MSSYLGLKAHFFFSHGDTRDGERQGTWAYCCTRGLKELDTSWQLNDNNKNILAIRQNNNKNNGNMKYELK